MTRSHQSCPGWHPWPRSWQRRATLTWIIDAEQMKRTMIDISMRENTSTLVRMPEEKAMLIVIRTGTAIGWNRRHRHLLPHCSTSIHWQRPSSGIITLICWHMPVRVSTMKMASICWPVWPCIKMPLTSIINRLHSHLRPPSPTIHRCRM